MLINTPEGTGPNLCALFWGRCPPLRPCHILSLTLLGLCSWAYLLSHLDFCIISIISLLDTVMYLGRYRYLVTERHCPSVLTLLPFWKRSERHQTSVDWQWWWLSFLRTPLKPDFPRIYIYQHLAFSFGKPGPGSFWIFSASRILDIQLHCSEDPRVSIFSSGPAEHDPVTICIHLYLGIQ